jgi:SAM-dependent methyltransferase
MKDYPVRRSGVGSHDVREIGLRDLLLYAEGSSVLDVGCNRGHVGYEFYRNGATKVHGCDVYAPGVDCARQWFTELTIDSKFEVVDLTKGDHELRRFFGSTQYDIVLFVGVLHKLKRVMPVKELTDLVWSLGQRSSKYLGWNGYVEDLSVMDVLRNAGMKRIHLSEFAAPGVAAVWKRT